MFMTVAAGLPAEMAAAVVHDPLWPALESVTHTISYDGLIMGHTQSGNPSAIARFANVKVPTLVMSGDKSLTHQRNSAMALAEILPDAQHQTVEGETHQFSAASIAPIVARFFGDS
jgi:pimeloyl-ACP methyl ester carboxylesterase